MTQSGPEPVSTRLGGYVLAGGRSARMGTDKAFLSLAGRPLIHHAVAKLRHLCADVHILAGTQPSAEFPAQAARANALAAHSPLVFDLHPNCGPIAGIEAALAHSPHQWNLILPVDMPLLPAELLDRWAREVILQRNARAAVFQVAGIAHAMPLMIHREAATGIAGAIARGQFALIAAVEQAARESEGNSLVLTSAHGPEAWFANLNTPEDFAQAEAHLNALDTL
jgi:molybdopterin-guanine dinucleotide biosynthesis protein A